MAARQAQPVRRLAVIGAGPLGRALAFLAARAGFDTVLEDVLPSNLRVARQALEPEAPTSLRYASSIEDAVRVADLVIDSVPDELESKLEIFSLIDRMAPPATILATPTRALSIADLASCTYRAERCLGLELPDEVKAGCTVGLVSTLQTAPEVLEAVQAFCAALGFRVELRVDSLMPR